MTQAERIAITFSFDGDNIAWRQWPSVPHIGESVALPHYENAATQILYTVEDVLWGMPEKPAIASAGTLTVRVLVTRPEKEVEKYRKRKHSD